VNPREADCLPRVLPAVEVVPAIDELVEVPLVPIAPA
jgi:hypothetical protein